MVHEFRIEFRLTTGAVRAWLVLFTLVFAASDLASESLTLTTYYPAPLGVYASLITTGVGGVNTALARDAGEVGIGTASPQQLLSVNGSMNVEQSNTRNTGTTAGSSSALDITFGSGSGEGMLSNRAGVSNNQYGLDFYTSFNDRMSITNSGNVGIGTTSPAYKLEINGDFGNPNSSTLHLYGSTVYDTGTSLHLNGGGGYVQADNTLEGSIIQSSKYFHATIAASGCTQAYDNWGCPGNYYATWAPGVYVENIWYGLQFPTIPGVENLYVYNGLSGTWYTVGTSSLNTFYCCPD